MAVVVSRSSLMKAVFDAVSGDARFTGKTFTGVADSTTALPFFVLNELSSSPPLYHSAGDVIEVRQIAFNCYEDNSEDASESLNVFEGIAEGSLSLDVGRIMASHKESDVLESDLRKEADGSDTGENVWHGLITYNFTIQRPLGG